MTRPRRSLLSLLGSGCLAGLTGCGTIVRPAPPADGCRPTTAPWPMAGRTPGRTGAAPDGSVPADPAVDRLLRTDGPVPPSASSSRRPGTASPRSRSRTATAGGDGPEGPPTPARSTDGEALWSTTGPGHLRTPVVADDRVYALGEGALLALDAADGTVAWRRDGPNGYGAGLAVADGRVYAAAGGGPHAVGRDLDGERLWRVLTGASGAAPVVAGETVLVPGAEGLAAVDTGTGERRWTVDALGGEPSRTVAVADGVVYASGFDGVYALR